MLKKLKNFCRLTRHSEGFTLVELVVVIAIVAILSGIAVPAYGAYVEKSQKAGDLQLLAAVNKAFAAACMENGLTVYEVEDAERKRPNITSYEAPITVDVFPEEFTKFFTGNEASGFEVIDRLMFVKGVFVDPTTNPEGIVQVSFGGETLYLTEEDVETLMKSAFGEIGTDGLLDKIAGVTDIATELMNSADSNSTFMEMLQGEHAGQWMADSFGVAYGSEDFKNAFVDVMAKKMEALKKANPDKYNNVSIPKTFDELIELQYNGDQLTSDAYNSISANNAVIQAAKNSTAQADKIFSILGKSGATGEIVKTINRSPEDGLSQAAMAYGLYTAYANRTGKAVPENPADALLAMDSDDFRDYINGTGSYTNGESKTDLDGYLSSMNMINDAQNNKEAVNDVLINGFGSDALKEALGEATRK